MSAIRRAMADARTQEQLLALNRSEVEAVAQVAGEVRREGRRGLYVGFAVNTFFGLRVVVTLLLTRPRPDGRVNLSRIGGHSLARWSCRLGRTPPTK